MAGAMIRRNLPPVRQYAQIEHRRTPLREEVEEEDISEYLDEMAESADKPPKKSPYHVDGSRTGKRFSVTPKIAGQLEEMRKSGMSVKEIAQKTGYHVSTVIKHTGHLGRGRKK
ncbi:MAG: hypothetical protein Q4C60_09570 [Eubacteriales bacterium]|nr:hypothetical protein [Eubacteriales bacterium]